MKDALQEFGGSLDKLRVRFVDLEKVVTDLVENRGTVPGTSVVTVTSETFRSDEAKRALFKIVTEWLTTILPESVTPAEVGPGDRSKLPFAHSYPRLVDAKEVKEPMRRALFKAMGLSTLENNQQYVDAFDHAYDFRVPVKRQKVKGEDEIMDAGIHQRFRKVRRGIKANRLAKNVKTYVDAAALESLEYPGAWRKPDRDKKTGCFFFQDESAAALFDGIFCNPQLEGFERVLSLCQLGVLDQMIVSKLPGSTKQLGEGNDQGIAEKTSILAEEVAASVMESGWQLTSLDDHAGCVCDCCFVVELGGYPSVQPARNFLGNQGATAKQPHQEEHDEGEGDDEERADGDAGQDEEENGDEDEHRDGEAVEDADEDDEDECD